MHRTRLRIKLYPCDANRSITNFGAAPGDHPNILKNVPLLDPTIMFTLTRQIVTKIQLNIEQKQQPMQQQGNQVVPVEKELIDSLSEKQ
ncbi:MAG: hypothetical protein CMJ26_04025 [Phycisphaerae bacterium]|nr:hypothetical protein [Phycisphaerae bacterium]